MRGDQGNNRVGKGGEHDGVAVRCAPAHAWLMQRWTLQRLQDDDAGRCDLNRLA